MRYSIFFSCMFITLLFLSTIPLSQSMEAPNDFDRVSHDPDDAPSWTVGATWIYRLKECDFQSENPSFYFNVGCEDLTVEVIEALSDYYRLRFTGRIVEEFDVEFNQFPLRMIGKTARFIPSRLEGEILVGKSSLELYEITISLSVFLKLRTYISDISLPLLCLPLPASMTVESYFDNPLPILSFPLYSEKIWGFPSLNITVDGKIQSLWLRVINVVHKMMVILKRDVIPPEIADLLPTIDIGDLLATIGGDNTFLINSSYWYDIPLFGTGEIEDITIGDRVFQVYNISLPNGVGFIYYAPEVRNIVKIGIAPEDTMFPYFPSFELELREATYL
jgi:hypothetical protein